MFKITGRQDPTQQGVSLVVEGRLAGAWVEELRTYCREVSANRQQCAIIDLTGVTFVDAEGKALLTQLWQQGIQLRGTGCLTRCVIEEITEGGKGNRSEQN